MNLACPKYILYCIGIQPAPIQASALEVEAGTCKINRSTIFCILSSSIIILFITEKLLHSTILLG